MIATITEPGILININRSFLPGMSAVELYEATRKDWVISPSSRTPQPQYAFATFRGIIQQVYEINTWHPSQARPGRLFFVGQIAPHLAHYIGESISHIKPGASNPIKYVNC